MSKAPVVHAYSDRHSFGRLMILISTLVKYPGIGSRDDRQVSGQEGLESLKQAMHNVASELQVSLLDCSIHTLRKDLSTLRQYGILNRNRHDWGYYLGTGAMNREELQLALNALASQATYQGDPQVRSTYQVLSQRLKSLDLESSGELFYPVRIQYNRAIIHTDPEEMIRKQQYRDTLFHSLETLETAILQGLPIELYFFRNPFGDQGVYRQVYPLQLLYYDVAWYLVMEDFSNGHLAVSRLDRFKRYLNPLNSVGRGVTVQRERLQLAHKLLENGWGLNLGNPQEQQQERQGTLPLIQVKVRFYYPAYQFIEEGERRHPRQKLRHGPKDSTTGRAAHLDYTVALPERSLDEFSRWVRRFASQARVLAPPSLVDQHRQEAYKLIKRYDDKP